MEIDTPVGDRRIINAYGAPLSEDVWVCARTLEDDDAKFELVDEQSVRLHVALPAPDVILHERMVPVFGFRRLFIG